MMKLHIGAALVLGYLIANLLHASKLDPHCRSFRTYPSTKTKSTVHFQRMYVVISTDLGNLQYAVSAPLTAFIWRLRFGVTPIVFVAATNQLSPKAAIVVHWLRRAGARVEMAIPRENNSLPTFVQCIRMAAYTLPYVEPRDYIFTADADIWPMSLSYWKAIFDFSKDMTIVNGEFYNSTKTLAMSYVGAPAYVWATVANEFGPVCPNQTLVHMSPKSNGVMRLPLEVADDLVAEGIRYHTPAVWFAPQGKNGVKWNWDQTFLSREFHGLVANCSLTFKLGSGLFARRLDRADWKFAGDVEHHNDAHLIFPATDPRVWSELMVVWRNMFAGDVSFPTDFKNAYNNAMV